MNDLYRKFVYTLYSIIILYIFFLGKSISADQTATIIADEIVSSNKTDIVNAKGDVIILNHDGTKIKEIGLGYKPFEDKDVYKIRIEKFDFVKDALDDYDTNNENLQEAFCELELTFSIESRVVDWKEGPKTYNFKRRFFSLNTFAKDPREDE